MVYFEGFIKLILFKDARYTQFVAIPDRSRIPEAVCQCVSSWF